MHKGSFGQGPRNVRDRRTTVPGDLSIKKLVSNLAEAIRVDACRRRSMSIIVIHEIVSCFIVDSLCTGGHAKVFRSIGMFGILAAKHTGSQISKRKDCLRQCDGRLRSDALLPICSTFKRHTVKRRPGTTPGSRFLQNATEVVQLMNQEGESNAKRKAFCRSGELGRVHSDDSTLGG